MAEDAGSISSAIRLELSKLRNDIQQGNQAIKDFGQKFEKATAQTSKKSSDNFNQIGLAAVAVAGVVANAFRGLVSTFADYEQSLANVQAVSGATANEFLLLKDAAEEAGATTRFSASQAADALFFLASAGFEATDSVEALDGVLLLAQATGEDLAKTSDTLTATISQFGLESEDAARVANVFAAANANSQATLTKLQTSLRQVGPVAGALGISLEETTASLQALFNAGFQGEQAGTALRSILLELSNASSATSKKLQELGVDLDTVNPEVVGLTGAVEGLTDAGVDLGEVFGKETAAQILVLSQTGGEALRKLEEDVTGTNAALEAAQIQTDTLQGSFDEFGSSLESATNAGIESITPFLRGLLDGISDLLRGFRDLPAGVKGFITTLTALGAAFGVAAAGASLLGVSITAALGPVGLGISAAVAGVIALANGFEAAGEQSKRAIFDVINSNQRLIDSLDTSEEAIRKNLDATDKLNDSQKLTADQIESLISRYPELAGQVDFLNLSVEEAVELEKELQKERAASTLAFIQGQRLAQQAIANGLRGEAAAAEFVNNNIQRIVDNGGRLNQVQQAVFDKNQDVIDSYDRATTAVQLLTAQERELADIVSGAAEARQAEAEAAAEQAEADEKAAQELAARLAAEEVRRKQLLEFIQKETETRLEALDRERDALLENVNDQNIIADITAIFERKKTEVLEEEAEERRKVREAEAKAEQEALKAAEDKAAQRLAQQKADAEEQKRIQEQQEAEAERIAKEERKRLEDERERNRVLNQERLDGIAASQELRRELLLDSLKGIDREREEALKALEDRVQALRESGVDTISITEFVARERKKIDDRYLEGRIQAEKDAFKESVKEASEAVRTIGGLARDSVSAITSLFTALIDAERDRLQALADAEEERLAKGLEQRLEQIDEETKAKLEAEGLIEETRIERLRREAEEARLAGEEETANEKLQEARRLGILEASEKQKLKEKRDAEEAIEKVRTANTKKQAELQYQADLARWTAQLAGAVAAGSRAVIEGVAAFPVPPFPFAIAAGALAGVEIAAVAAAQPRPPQLATGGIAVPTASGSGAQVVVAENNAPELILNGGESGKPLLRDFAREVAGELSGTQTIQLVVDGRVLAEVAAKQYNNGTVRLAR